jgi:hypothetical protein
MNITEDYVSFEVAKLLKERGFDEKTLSYYEDNVLCHGDWFEWNRSPLGHVAAPTLQMAMKWLREVHNKHCDIGYDIDVKWFFQIIDLKETIEDHYTEMKFYHSNNQCNFKSYEQAAEAALKYTLENLENLM